jgi:hypothetical protein
LTVAWGAGLAPRPVKHAISGGLARVEAREIAGELRDLASGSGPIVAGPWLGEVGFELLYWVPFLAWFTERFHVAPSRLWVISRGGTASWYRGIAGGYRDVLEIVTPDAFRAQHDARLAEIGEQKQLRPIRSELELAARLTWGTPAAHAPLLHPSLMYRLLKRYWWGHLDEAWVHRHARYRRLTPPAHDLVGDLPPGYTAVKFYFNDCFPATDANRAFVRRVLTELAADGPVVSLSAGVALDDHHGCHVPVPGVLEPEGTADASRNLEMQAAVVAHARRFAGTYGGFAYLAPFYGVPATGYFSLEGGFARSHLLMAQSAFEAIGMPAALTVRTAGLEVTRLADTT